MRSNRSSEDGLKYFIIDRTGEIVIDATKYSRVLPFSEGLAAVRSDRGWGFIDKRGQEIIRPQFAEVSSFSEGLAPVQVNGSWGFIDRQGQMVIAPQYSHASLFSEGIAVVIRSEQTNTFDLTKRFGSRSTVTGSRRIVRRELIVGAAHSNESQTAEEANRELLLIDTKGHSILSRSFSELQVNLDGKISEGLIEAYEPKTKKFGFVDKSGTFVIPANFVQVGPFSEGLARAAIIVDGEEKMGLIDHSGEFIIPPRFKTDADFSRNSTDFSEGLAGIFEESAPTITESSGYSYIDRKGTVILRTPFSYADRFNDGLACVYDSEKGLWGFMDKTGRLAIPIQYDSASDFSDGLAVVAHFASGRVG